MTRQIHQLITDGEKAVAVVQTERSGGGDVDRLETVRMDAKDVHALWDTRIVDSLYATQCESINHPSAVNAKSTGPRSHFRMVLDDLIEEAPSHLAGQVFLAKTDVRWSDVEDFQRVAAAHLMRSELNGALATLRTIEGGDVPAADQTAVPVQSGAGQRARTKKM